MCATTLRNNVIILGGMIGGYSSLIKVEIIYLFLVKPSPESESSLRRLGGFSGLSLHVPECSTQGPDGQLFN